MAADGGPVAAYDLYCGNQWLEWHPAPSVAVARIRARAAVDAHPGRRYVLYNRSGLAVEEGPTVDEARYRLTDHRDGVEPGSWPSMTAEELAALLRDREIVADRFRVEHVAGDLDEIDAAHGYQVRVDHAPPVWGAAP